MNLITWNPDDRGTAILTNENLTCQYSNASGYGISTIGRSSGKWYYEMFIDAHTHIMFGVSNLEKTERWMYHSIGRSYYNSTYTDNYGIAVQKDMLFGIALDLDEGTLEFFINGSSQGIFPYTIASEMVIYPYTTSGSSTGGSKVTANFGATPFQYPVPEGYLPYDYENAGWFNLNKILILSSDSKVISRDEADENWIQVGESLSSSLFEDYGLDDVSKYTNIDWQMLHNNFTAPFSFKVFRESDVAPTVKQTVLEKEFGVLGSVYEKELSENELEEIRNITIG